jgi:antitoxin ParD1/3/4
MNVSLTRELAALVQEKVRSGLYQSASEVIREALRLLRERDQVRQLQLKDLRKEIGAAKAQVAKGQVAPLDMRAIKAKARSRWKESR